jgi:hypothetical protein
MTARRRRIFTSHGALAWFLAISLSISGSWGCAMFRDPVPPGFERISIQAQVERDKHGNLEGDLVAHSTLKGVLIGTFTGAPSGAIVGGGGALGISLLVCSPMLIFYPFCVIAWTGAGTIGGFVVGLVGGGTMGAIGGLPSKTANEVTEVLARLEEARNFDDDMLTAMRRAVAQEKQVDAADAAAVVTARLHEFDLRQHSKDRLSVRLWASMVQAWQIEGEKPKENTCKYRYTSEKKEAEAWLADGGVAFGEALTQAIETFARWMNRDLEAFATGTELPKTEEDPRSCFQERRWYSPFLF